MFLAVARKKVIDVAFQAEIVEDLAAVPPVVGVPEIAEVSHEEVDQIYLEDAPAQVAQNMANGLLIKYFDISVNTTSFATTLRVVTLKSGARAAGPTREVVEIEANGVVVGSAIRDV